MKLTFENPVNKKPLETGVQGHSNNILVRNGTKEERMDFLKNFKKHNNLELAFFISYEDQMGTIKQGNGMFVFKKKEVE